MVRCRRLRRQRPAVAACPPVDPLYNSDSSVDVDGSELHLPKVPWRWRLTELQKDCHNEWYISIYRTYVIQNLGSPMKNNSPKRRLGRLSFFLRALHGCRPPAKRSVLLTSLTSNRHSLRLGGAAWSRLTVVSIVHEPFCATTSRLRQVRTLCYMRSCAQNTASTAAVTARSRRAR